MELHKVGNCVEIGEKLIPAVNIQVEGVPGYLMHTDGTNYWYGVYFEVMFEDGDRWEVEHGFELDEATETIIRVKEYPEGSPRSTYAWIVQGWDRFLDTYDTKRAAKYPYSWRHLLDPSLENHGR